MKLSQSYLIAKSKGFAKKYWNMELNIPIEFSAKLTRRLGYFRYSSIGPIKIMFTADFLGGNYTEATIDSVIKHELAHWALFMKKEPHKDVDWNFKKECNRIGASLTGTIEKSGSFYTAICECCKKIIVRERSEQKAKKYCQPKYTTKCCKAKIIYNGFETIEDTNAERLGLVPETKIAAENAAPTQIKTEKVAPININNTQKPLVVLIPGPRGITNQQMIPAINNAVEKSSKEELVYLRNKYPEIYQSSLKYIKSKQMKKLSYILMLPSLTEQVANATIEDII